MGFGWCGFAKLWYNLCYEAVAVRDLHGEAVDVASGKIFSGPSASLLPRPASCRP